MFIHSKFCKNIGGVAISHSTEWLLDTSWHVDSRGGRLWTPALTLISTCKPSQGSDTPIVSSACDQVLVFCKYRNPRLKCLKVSAEGVQYPCMCMNVRCSLLTRVQRCREGDQRIERRLLHYKHVRRRRRRPFLLPLNPLAKAIELRRGEPDNTI